VRGGEQGEKNYCSAREAHSP